MTDRELISALEANGYPGAAENIACGQSQAEVTTYIVGREPYYNDGEGRALQRYIDTLSEETAA